jgi:hypothetical protein
MHNHRVQGRVCAQFDAPVPVFEEVFFRGLLLGWLRNHMRERSL